MTTLTEATVKNDLSPNSDLQVGSAARSVATSVTKTAAKGPQAKEHSSGCGGASGSAQIVQSLWGALVRKLFIDHLALWSAFLALGADVFFTSSGRHPPVDRPYFRYFLYVTIAIFIIWPLIVKNKPASLEKFRQKDKFYAAAFLFLNVLNLVTGKFTLLPPLFFPTPDRILSILVEDFTYLIFDCLAGSAKLLLTGFSCGALAGLITGIAIGFSKPSAYWLNPMIKILGPIPPTAWIPIVLVAFPTTWTGAVFLIALSVWFPTSVMTSSGILNVQNAYFEVSSTLGAKRLYQIFLVGIPAAMPLIFTGLFSGACSSFLTLMTAEMVGVKNGIGWYINWQREMLAYANVYAGLIIIALSFYSLITLFFKIRDRVLVWQKGMIKW
ncbi:MAG: ABC transporter permease subunit [Deltaproteobacteria bacterium]|jgi:NitT/TauT family transport system permease protein|nr:ABC transporter permease subunit [Deltaproteobacteria bacterium]